MRAGLTVSIVAHAAIIGFGFIAFPEAKPFQAPDIEALPVELVSTADMTDLLQGDKTSKVLPQDAPQPKPSVQAEVPAPAPPEKPAPKPVEAAAPPTPTPPPAPEPEPPTPEPPKPEPAPKPAEVAALDPAEAIEPVPAVPAEPAKPRPRPVPPKPVAQPKPPEKKPEVVEKPKDKFNPDEIQALLNKQEPAGGGDPAPAPEPQTLGSIDGHADAAMTQSEIDALKAKLYQCWNPPVAVREASTLVVKVRITLLPDGSLSGSPQMVGIEGATSPLAQVAVEAAIRAVVQCAPFGDILKPENYALWNQIDFVFDPSQMLGG
jgi:outer membrane biosynthesis protein TonB